MAGETDPPIRSQNVTGRTTHDPNTTVSAGWALMGKEPNSNDEYAVLRSSGGFFPRAGFDEILRRFTPGTPPPRSIEEWVPDALPWVTVSYAPRNGGTVLGIAVRTWSDQVDGARRPIATTSYLCVPFADLTATPASYAALYSAVRDAGIAERPDSSAPVPVALAPLDAGDVATSIEQFGQSGFTLVAATAALLLAHPVSVLGGPTGDPDEQMARRLRFLDAVAALLPYGQRSKLVASTWADGGSAHRIRLAFTNRPRPGHTTVRWPLPDKPPFPDIRCAHYFDLLVILLEHGRTIREIVEYLASAVEPHRIDDPGYALHCLAELDPRFSASQSIRNGTARIDELRRLLLTKRIDELDPTIQRKALWLLLEAADAEDLELVKRTWQRWAAENPVSGELHRWLVTAVGVAGRNLLWVHASDSTALKRLLGLADDLGFADQLLATLLDASTARQEAHGTRWLIDQMVSEQQRCATAATLVLEQFSHRRLLAGQATVTTDEQVLAVITHNAPAQLALELIRQMTEPHSNTTAEQVRARLEWLETSDPLRERLRLFRDVLDGAPSLETISTAEAHEKQRRAYVLALLRLARQAGHRPAAKLLPYALVWLLRTAPRLRWADHPVWIDELRQATPDPARTDELEAILDLLLLAFNAQPRRALYLRVKGSSGSGDRYVNSFSTSFEELCGNDTANRNRRSEKLPGQVVMRLVEHIEDTGWPQSPQAVDRILLLLHGIATTATATEGRPAARAVSTFLDTRPDLAKLASAAAWETLIERRYPELTKPGRLSRTGRWLRGTVGGTGREHRGQPDQTRNSRPDKLP